MELAKPDKIPAIKKAQEASLRKRALKKYNALALAGKDGLSQNQISDAFALYMRFVPIARICHLTQINEKELGRFINGAGGWKTQRAIFHKEVSEEIKQHTLNRLKNVTGVGISLIENCFMALAKNASTPDQEGKLTPVTIEHASQIAEIFSKLHKAKIMEESMGEVARALSMTPQKIIQAFVEDPFMGAAIEAAMDQAIEDKVRPDMPQKEVDFTIPEEEVVFESNIEEFYDEILESEKEHSDSLANPNR